MIFLFLANGNKNLVNAAPNANFEGIVILIKLEFYFYFQECKITL